MKINPVSFNKAQRTGLFGQAPPAVPRGRSLREEGLGLRAAEGEGGPASCPRHVAVTRMLDKHPRHAERCDLGNAIMYF